MGLHVLEHEFPDHYSLTEKDLNFDDQLPIFITEKDAVKCQHVHNEKIWVVKVSPILDEIFKTKLLARLKEAL